MIFESKNLNVFWLEPGIAQLTFDAEGSVNKFDRDTLSQLDQALDALTPLSELQGLVVSSAKNVFIVGADITEFLALFSETDQHISQWLEQTNAIFNKLEDLPVPSIAAVNGYALGGGCEAILACDLRIADHNARIGLPETKLGLIPGFGGTVRLPRLIGADNAMEWMISGKEHSAQAALEFGTVDAVIAAEKLQAGAIAMLKNAINGDIDWQARRAQKQAPLALSEIEAKMAFASAQAMVAKKAGSNYPAPHAVVKTLEQACTHSRAQALKIETDEFIKLAKGDVATAMIGLFLNEQFIKGKTKKLVKQTTPIQQATVLGAGIMGGGIAYQSAIKGTPIVMKDINQAALDLGLAEASKLLTKRVERGQMKPDAMAKVLNNIVPTLDYSPIQHTEVIIEAVVENPKIKAMVLAEVEELCNDQAVLASNTSTISINQLASSLKRPEQFCGMHFFNPVHRMPLVEVIRGEHTSDDTIAKVVAYAAKMGKTPIVVNDCPGFFVNRVLFPYLMGFGLLLKDGADFQQIDKVMQQFGWPMGPAYLLDVIGLDTSYHCLDVMAKGIPERMPKIEYDPIELMFNEDRLGQKNGLGFYQYTQDRRGKPKKSVDEQVIKRLADAYGPVKSFEADEIIARTMVPMINETVRCLEEGIIASPAEADMALLYGIGFPPFRGGVFRYLDTLGLDSFVAMADQYAHLGPMYQVTDKLREMATQGARFYQGK